MKWLNGFSLAETFEGEFSDVTRSYAGKGLVRYGWSRRMKTPGGWNSPNRRAL
jgi:hypothetical protein